MAKNLKKGVFISFEGSEGSGKSTQSRMLADFLKKKGLRVVHVWDPGSTSVGEAARKILLTPGNKVSPAAEAMLYMAARAQLVDEKIRPELGRGTVVICDRFMDATVCYQGYGLGMDIDMINRMNAFVTGKRAPDITFFLDADVRKGILRSRKVKGYSDRIERRSIDFHKKVRNGYIALSKRFPRRIKRIMIEANGIEKIQALIRKEVLNILQRYI